MRFLSLIHALIGLTSLCGAAPAGDTASIETRQTAPSNLAPARKLPDDVGLPSQLAWEAWLIIAKRPDVQSSFESATVPRRIAPKSIFVAPSRDAESQCSDGYKRNETGHCVQDKIKIDPMNSRLDFLRKRLSMFPPRVNVDDSSAVESASAPVSEPVKVNLGSEDTGPMEISLVQVRPVHDSGSPKDEDVMTLYKVGTGTKSDGESETFIRVNSTDLPVRGVVVPVADIVDDKNQPVIDYQTPVDVEIVESSETGLKQAVDSITETNPEGDAQPTVILLLSPTKSSAGTEPSEISEATTVQEDEATTVADETTTSQTEESPSTTIDPEEDTEDQTDEILLHGEAGLLVSTSPTQSTENEEGNVSSESSINGDMIMETTLVDVEPGTTTSQSELEDFRELFETEEFAPEVVSSPQDSHGLTVPSSRITKRTGDPERSSALETNPHQEDNADSHLQQRRKTSDQNRVRFPDEQRTSGHVSFPSDHQSNSIRGSLDSKVAATRSQPTSGQMRTYYQLPPGWRFSDPQHQAVPRSNSQLNPNQMRLRFWARMPLVRDPSLTGGSSRNAYRGQSARTGQVQIG